MGFGGKNLYATVGVIGNLSLLENNSVIINILHYFIFYDIIYEIKQILILVHDNCSVFHNLFNIYANTVT